MLKLIYLNIILLFIFSFSSGQINFQIQNTPETFKDNIYYSYNFKISYYYSTYNFGTDYLSIKIENKRTDYLGQIAFLSFNDEQCESERKHMSLNSGGDSIFIIKKSEFVQNYCYICVKCIVENKCNYTIIIDQIYIPCFPMIDTSYTYYASEKYTQMKFRIRAEDPIRDLIKRYNNNNIYELFWIKRLYNNKFIPYDNNQVPADYNAIYLTNEISQFNRYVEFDILSTEKDEIKVGNSLIINGVNNKALKVNDIEIIGHLKKGIFEKECFNFELNNYYSSGEQFCLQGYIYDKFAKTYFKNINSYSSNREKEIIDGIIFEIMSKNEVNSKQFCVEFLNSDKYEQLNNITFSIQLISHKFNTFNYYFNSPQIPEIVFPRYLKSGEYMILPNIQYPKKSSTMSITVNSIYGYPKFSLYNCLNFPRCDDFSQNDLKEIQLNKLEDYDTFLEYTNSFNKNKTLLIVNCLDITDYCIFDTTFFSENDYILLS